jgi:ankyrin repeat protein
MIPKLTGKQSDFLKIVVAAAGRGDLEAVETLLNQNPDWIHTIGSHGRTMLWEAAYWGKRQMVESLIEQGAEVNTCGCHHIQHRVEISPYCVARYEGHGDVAAYLLANGATVDIHTAAYLGDIDSVRALLEENPTLVNQPLPQHDAQREVDGRLVFDPQRSPWATPLCYAAVNGHKVVAELLISRGAEIKPHSERMLDYAVARNHVDVVKLLLENGADVDKAPRILADRREMAGLLKSYGVEPDDPNAPRSWPPLVYRSRGDKGEHPEVIQRLLSLGANPDIRNYKGKTALHCAAKAGFIRVIEVLLENGADVNAADHTGETPLFDAIRSTIKDGAKKIATVDALLSSGADPNFENHKGITPLQVARKARRKEATEIVEMLG